ncbi:MAG: MerR family DNA-binding transcriptional regulator [Promethearchaeota archaeon]
MATLGLYYVFSPKSVLLLSISQAAPILGVCSKTLRRWDGKGLLCPDCRTPGGHRRYGL